MKLGSSSFRSFSVQVVFVFLVVKMELKSSVGPSGGEEGSSSCSPPGSPTVLLKTKKKSPRASHHNMEFRIEVLEWARSGSGGGGSGSAPNNNNNHNKDRQEESASNPAVTMGNIIEDIDLSSTAELSPKSANKTDRNDSIVSKPEGPRTLEDLTQKEVNLAL